ncbi:hypothetical protein V8C26DRAFT_433245 [Trichoderma gracile]
MGRPKDASTPLRAAPDGVRCDGMSTKSREDTPIDDSDESRTLSGAATPTSSHNDTSADDLGGTPRGGDLSSEEASNVVTRLAQKFARRYVSEPTTNETLCFSKGSRRQLLNH